ncbi:hypothetical protein HG536_0G00840 [Torulaspora globosa]|uniref:Transcriptional coactivator p15 (PC4) C-terminal domain-containing protein n=1 Tax=Torulaspora globosa TaxID=48254 RepID=A0A7G3ZL41_9SACH|nr:uncharacterized protein HG536_0G00840 [Torulaspora globosa]QLL34227.1 hypothetical protein HG536_0G00840 [Torulaspora globosa]
MSYYNRYRNRKKFDGSGTSSSNGGGSGGLAATEAVFDLGKNKRVTVRQFRNVNLIDIREYYMDTSTGEMKPGKKGISLTEDLYDELLKHRLNIDEALRRFGSKRPRTKTVRLLSDDEEESGAQADVKEADSSATGHDDDNATSSSSKRKKPAPPTLLPQEEKRQNDEREANAPLVVPGLAKKRPPAPDANAAQPRLKEDDEDAGNAIDEEFVQNLEAEMNRPDDEVSEEE